MDLKTLQQAMKELEALGIPYQVVLSYDPTPVVPPVITKNFMVTKDPRANAFWSEKSNAADKPIMEIYPSNDSSPSERKQYAKGVVIKVASSATVADGGNVFWKIIEDTGINETLYMRASDGVVR